MFRSANFNLVLAGILSILMLFAPLAYAADYGNSVYAWQYGSFFQVETALVDGTVVNVETFFFLSSIPTFFFTMFTAGSIGLLFYAVFKNADVVRKLRYVRMAVALMVAQILMATWAALTLFHHLGTSSEGETFNQLEAQFFIIFFPPVFALLAHGRIARALRRDALTQALEPLESEEV